MEPHVEEALVAWAEARLHKEELGQNLLEMQKEFDQANRAERTAFEAVRSAVATTTPPGFRRLEKEELK